MAMTTAAVKALLAFLSSLNVNTWLASAALFALCCSLISGNLSTVELLTIVAWIAHFAAMAAIDIYKKGGEL